MKVKLHGQAHDISWVRSNPAGLPVERNPAPKTIHPLVNPWFSGAWIKNSAVLLFIILIAASFFRLYALDRHDVLTDEAAIGFRSIGYLDFMASPDQPTPLEWSDQRPWWMYLSFHDHPPLNFLIHHLFFKLFGVSLFVLRIVPAFFGILSVFALYLIGKKLANNNVGLLAAGLFAINDYHVWISRIALQESAVIFFMLASFLIFLWAIENKKYFYVLGVLSGLSLLIKLTSVIIIPTIILYLLLFCRQVFKQKELYISFIIAMGVFSPYAIYNIFLRKTFGHYDFQISHLLGQEVTAWQIRPGRQEFETLASSFKYFFINLKDGFSPAFITIAALSLVITIYFVILKKNVEQKREARSILVIFLLTLAFLIFVGPSRRFLSLLIPWLVLLVAIFFAGILQKARRHKIFMVLLLFAFLAYEVYYSVNTNLSANKLRENIDYAHLKQLAYPYGYNHLETYLKESLKNKKPAVILPIQNKNISRFVNKQAQKKSGNKEAIMLIYDPRLLGESVLWILTRRLIYEGWPVASFDVYAQALETEGKDIFHKLGIETFFYIAPTEKLILDNSFGVDSGKRKKTKEAVQAFEAQLIANMTIVTNINDDFGNAVFRVYRL